MRVRSVTLYIPGPAGFLSSRRRGFLKACGLLLARSARCAYGVHADAIADVGTPDGFEAVRCWLGWVGSWELGSGVGGRQAAGGEFGGGCRVTEGFTGGCCCFDYQG